MASATLAIDVQARKSQVTRWRERQQPTVGNQKWFTADISRVVVADCGLAAETVGDGDEDVEVKMEMIHNLDHAQYTLRTPIWITVKSLGDSDYMATSDALAIGASGDSQEEAIDNLKDMIVCKFETLRRFDRLGAFLQVQLRLLAKLIKEHD